MRITTRSCGCLARQLLLSHGLVPPAQLVEHVCLSLTGLVGGLLHITTAALLSSRFVARQTNGSSSEFKSKVDKLQQWMSCARA